MTKPKSARKVTPSRQKRAWVLWAPVLVLLAALAYGMQRGRSTPTPATAPTAARTSPFNADRAFADLRTMVGFGPRPAGSEAIAKTRAYIVAELQKVGLTFQHIGILSLEFHVDKLSRPLL